MKRLIALILALLLAVPVFAKRPYDSIRPLQWADEDGKLATHCTTWKLNNKWMTDAHCVLDGDHVAKVQFFIDGKKAYVDRVDGANDLAELHGGPSARGLKMSVKAPAKGDEIVVIGYPFGWSSALYTSGVYAGEEVFEDDPTQIPYAMYNVAGAPGVSGSPVLTKDGMVIGQVQITLCGGMWSGFCPIIGGATYENLKAFAGE